MYIALLDNVLIDFGETFGTDYMFQQDNAAIHVPNTTKAFLNRRQIECWEWPACSTNLNSIENVWGILSTNIYANGRQYDNIRELKKAITEIGKKLISAPISA